MAKTKSPRRVLPLIALFLLASGGVRMVTGMGPAIAYAETHIVPAEPQGEVEENPIDISPLLQALQDREARVRQRETAIEDRLRALAVAEDELTRRLSELRAAEASLSATLARSETANDGDIARLTTVYENMKPADAAGLFEQMEPQFAAGFLVRMTPQSAAAIMAGLDPQTAYSVSVIIAGRNANAPTQ